MAQINDTFISIRVPKEMKRQLKLLCISMSKQEGKVITLAEFIKGLLKPFVREENQISFLKKNKSKRNTHI